MAAPTSTNEVTARKLSSSISALWTKIKSTFQPVADRVTSIRASSSATDTNYPSEKAVAAALESKAPSAVTSEVTIANGDKMIIADASDSSKLKRASAAFDGSTTKKFLNQKGTFTQVLEADLEWGGDFRNSKSPSEAYTRQNLWFYPRTSAVSIEYCTDRTSDNPTWLPYVETETNRLKLFSGGEETAAAFYCGKNTHVHPGYTGSISGTKDLTDDIVPDQGLRITICCRSLSSRDADVDSWSYGQIVRILMNVSTNSATGGPRHCKVETMTGANFKAGNDTWTDRGDYNLSGDSGWNSIPLQITFGGGWTQTSQIWVVRFTIWAEALRADPVSSQTGNLKINTIAALTKTTWTNDAMKRYGTPYSITETGGAVFKDIKFTSRKLKTNLARTSDSTFDGSADQTNIPVTGTLPVGNGGTGRTSVTSGNYVVGAGTSAMVEKTPKEVGSNVLSSLDDKSNASSYANFVDGDFVVGSDHVDASTISASTFVRRTALNLWNYIKGKLTGSDVNIGGNAVTATTAKDYDANSGTIKTALALKSDTGHVHNTDANEVTSNSTNLDVVTDDTEIVTTHTSGYNAEDKRLFRRPAGSKIWPWIQSKIEADSGYINYTYNVTSDTNINSHVLAGIILPGSSLGSCRLMFAMVVNFNIGEGTGCGGLLKVHIEISGGGIYYVKRISLSNVTGVLSISDLKIVEGTSANKKVVGLVWNGVLLSNRPMQATVLSRHVVGGDFVYNGDVASGTNIAWETGGARVWAEDGNVVHTTGDETIQGLKTFSNTAAGNDLDINLQSVTNNGTYKMGVEIAASGRRGLWDYSGTGIAGEGKWIVFKDVDNVVHVGDDTAQRSKVKIGGITFDFSGTIGTASNTLYIG